MHLPLRWRQLPVQIKAQLKKNGCNICKVNLPLFGLSFWNEYYFTTLLSERYSLLGYTYTMPKSLLCSLLLCMTLYSIWKRKFSVTVLQSSWADSPFCLSACVCVINHASIEHLEVTMPLNRGSIIPTCCLYLDRRKTFRRSRCFAPCRVRSHFSFCLLACFWETN